MTTTPSNERIAETERYRRLALDFFTDLGGVIDLREWLTDDIEYVVVDANDPETTAAIPWVGLHKGIEAGRSRRRASLVGAVRTR